MCDSFPETLTEYIDIVCNLKPPEDESILKKYMKIFRGCPSKTYDYIPSIGRKIGNSSNNALLFEREMIEESKRKIPELFADDNYPIQTLTKLQHFGLPTRLLDFTTNALVALYFACQEKTINGDEQDGKVLVTYKEKDEIYNNYSPFVNAYADMCKDTTTSHLNEYLEKISLKDYWKSVKNNHVPICKVVERFSEPIFFKPELNNERLIRQQGIFLIIPDKIDDYEDDKKIIQYFITDKLCKWNPTYKREIIIQNKYKKNILRCLFDMGITKSFIFPEPENVCSEIYNDIKEQFKL